MISESSPWTRSAELKSPQKGIPFSMHFGFPSLLNPLENFSKFNPEAPIFIPKEKTEENNNDPQKWLDLIKKEEENGKLEECQRLILLGLSYCPHNESLLLKGIKFHEQRRNRNAARAILSKIQDVPLEKTWKVVLEGALMEARAGNIQVSRKIFQYLMKNSPTHGPIYHEFANFEENQGKEDLAIEILEKGILALPKYGPLWFTLFQYLEKKGSIEKLRETIERSLLTISKELVWKVYYEAASFEERQGNIQNARENLIQSCLYSLPTLRWKVWVAGSKLELKQGNIQLSKSLLNKALEEVPYKTKALILLECSKMEEDLGNIEKAREIMSRAKKEAKHEWKVYLESILFEIRIGDKNRAIEEAKEALSIHQRTGRLWAILIQLTDDEDTKLKIFQEALLQVPKSGEVWCEGARIRMTPSSKFDLKKAKKYLKFAINFTPQYGDSFIEYLKLKILKGPFTENQMIRFEQKCIHSDPNYGPLWFQFKLSPLDNVKDILKRAKQFISLELYQRRNEFQRKIIEQDSK